MDQRSVWRLFSDKNKRNTIKIIVDISHPIVYHHTQASK